MAKTDFFKPTFDALAVDGCIGHPMGKLAYAYIRVSSDDQADEGRSGLPRQIAHIHEVACTRGYKIPWEFVFADDHTGFKFEDRPRLTDLRNEFKSPNRRADAVIIEHLDRLSRDARWHQGYLLDEMRSNGVTPIFWKEFNSLIEQVVVGAVAQEAMEQAKERMLAGVHHKARDGRVTTKSPAYGYKLVDSQGNEGFAAKKDTHYGIKEEEATIVRLIYRRMLEGVSMRQIAIELHHAGVKPPKKTRRWEATQIRLILKNDVYKGDYYANRWQHVIVQQLGKDGFSIESKKRKVERPQEEWIHVPVPAIVSKEEWEEANRILTQNKKMAKRNASQPYLLTGLIKCAYCGLSFTGQTSRTSKGKPRKKTYRGYRCSFAGIRPQHFLEHLECKSSYVLCEVLDGAVWRIVCQALLEPETLIAALESDAVSDRNKQLNLQISYIKNELRSKDSEDEKLLKAYLAGAFDENEYASKRRLLKQEVLTLETELKNLSKQVMTPEQLEERKKAVLAISEEVKAKNFAIDPPFELKQRIIKLVVDQIVVDTVNQTVTVKGAINRMSAIVNTPADTDSWPR